MSPRGDQDKWNAAGKDVVVLHMFKRASYQCNTTYMLTWTTEYSFTDVLPSDHNINMHNP